MSDVHTRFRAYCRVLAQQAHNEYVKLITPVMYLYGHEGGDQFNGKSGYTELVLARECPRYFELVITTHVPRDKTVNQLSMWFYEHLRREPIVHALPQKLVTVDNGFRVETKVVG